MMVMIPAQNLNSWKAVIVHVSRTFIRLFLDVAD